MRVVLDANWQGFAALCLMRKVALLIGAGIDGQRETNDIRMFSNDGETRKYRSALQPILALKGVVVL